MNTPQITDDNSAIVSVEIGNANISYNPKVVLSPEQIHTVILQADELLNRTKPKTTLDAIVNSIFAFILSAGIVFCVSLMVVFIGFIIGIGNEIGELIIKFLQISFILIPFIGIGVMIRRHIIENKKTNAKRVLLEKIKKLYSTDLKKSK